MFFKPCKDYDYCKNKGFKCNNCIRNKINKFEDNFEFDNTIIKDININKEEK